MFAVVVRGAGPVGRNRATRHDQAVDRLPDRQLPAVQRGAREGLRAADARRPHQQVDTRGSLGNIEALQDGTVDIGLSQAGIAYMAYNGRLRNRAGDARHSRHRHTEFLSGASARRPRLSNSLDGRTAGPSRRHRPRRQRRRCHLSRRCWRDISRRVTCTK